MNLAEIIEEALMTNKEVADRSGLSVGTVSRMVNGHPASRLSTRKVLYILGQKLGRKIELNEIEGLNLSNGEKSAGPKRGPASIGRTRWTQNSTVDSRSTSSS